MGYSPSDSLRARNKRDTVTAQKESLPNSEDQDNVRRANGKQSLIPDQRFTTRTEKHESKLLGNDSFIKKDSSMTTTSDGQKVAYAKRLAIGGLEISETIEGPGFKEKQIFGIPVYRSGRYNQFADQVHQNVNSKIKKNSDSSKDSDVVREDPKQKQHSQSRQRQSNNQSARSSQDIVASNQKALIAATGKQNPTNQDVYNTLRRHYGSDSAVYKNSQKDFGINAGALVKDQNSRQTPFGNSVNTSRDSAPARNDRAPEQRQQTPQEIVNAYYKAAGVTRAERNTSAGFNKAQNYATKIGHKDRFDAAIAAKNSHN